MTLKVVEDGDTVTEPLLSIEANRAKTIRILEPGDYVSVEVEGGFVSRLVEEPLLELVTDKGSIFASLDSVEELINTYKGRDT